MAFVAPCALPLRPRATRHARPSALQQAVARSRPRACAPSGSPAPSDPREPSSDLSAVPPATLTTQVYGPTEDVCSFGEECSLSEECVSSSPALERLADKYIFPMREENTQVFFDNAVDGEYTVLIVFDDDRHGLVLDIVSVLKALGVRVHRTASAESDALQLILPRLERELVSVTQLGLSLDSCTAFWISDEESGDKIDTDGARLDQIAQCMRLELDAPYPRPRPARPDRWHRVCLQRNRAARYSVFSVHTADRPGLLATVTAAFDALEIDVASASIKTCSNTRAENHFFVTKRGFKQPLNDADMYAALDAVMAALLRVGEPLPHETLWYQTRDGSEVVVAEAIFIDEVNNRELACFRFSQFETPNFRGRLPDAPYRPVLLA